MKKLLPKLVLIGIAGLILLGIAASVMFKPAVRKAIEGGSHTALGVPTHLDSFSAGLGFGTSAVGIEDFSAENPEGFGDERLLSVHELSVEVATFTLLSDTIEVPGIRMRGLELRLIQDGARSNFAEVLKHLRSFGGSGGSDPGEDGSTGGGKQIAFGLVDIGPIKTHFDLRGIPGFEDQWDFELPGFQLDFSDPDQKSPSTVAEFSARMMDELLARAVAEARGLLPEDALKLLELGQGGLDAGLDDVKEKAKDVLDDAKAKAKKLEKGLGGLQDR